MELTLKRTDFTEKSTIGELFVDGEFECFTLEDKVREIKIPGITAIPAGRYEIVVTFSNRFQKPLPLLMQVPNFEGVRIHTGNTSENTEGCILVGQEKKTDFVGASKLAFEPLFAKIKAALEVEKVFIDVS